MPSNKQTLELLDDMNGYYKCTCGHYAVSHFMDAPPKYQQCHKCTCQTFKLAPKAKAKGMGT